MGRSNWQKKLIEARQKSAYDELNKLLTEGKTKTEAVNIIANTLGVSTVTVYTDLKTYEK